MPTQEDVTALVRAGCSYEEIGRKLRIPPGQAYLIATGLPADGGDVLPAADLRGRTGLLEGSSQHLANPPADLPKSDETVAAWMRRRAHGDAQMQQAAAERTLQPPGIADGQETDLLTVLGRQHNQLKYLQERLEAEPSATRGAAEEHRRSRKELVEAIRRRLAPHGRAEEASLWPAVCEVLPDGEELARRGRAEDGRTQQVLRRLGDLRAEDEDFDSLAEDLARHLRRHVALQDAVFLRLAQALPPTRRRELGRAALEAADPGPEE